MDSRLLQEDANKLLQETGDAILLDGATIDGGTPQMGGSVIKAPRVLQYTAVTGPVFPPTPAVPAPDLSSPVIDYGIRARAWFAQFTEVRQPILPIVALSIQRIIGTSIQIPEQSGGSYLTILRDPSGQIVNGGALTALAITLYTINADNSLTVVNNRNHMPCLNMADVTVYNAVQFTATGKPFNLRWKIQPADTTLVNAALPFERHIALFEWTWGQGHGKQEVVLVVRNLTTVH